MALRIVNVHGRITAIEVPIDPTGLRIFRPLGAPSQVLAVTSDGLRLEWVNPTGGGGGDVGTDLIFDVKGDLAVGTGSNTAARLPVGANGLLLRALSSETTGLVWASLAHSELTGVGANDHHNAVTLAADADTLLGLSTQQITLDPQSPNTVLAGPSSGSTPADPTFRTLTPADFDITGVAVGGDLSGTLPNPSVVNDSHVHTHANSLNGVDHTLLINVGASDHHAPVTLAADAHELLGLTGQSLTFDDQDANTILAGPTSGAATDPVFRALVAADLGTGAEGSGLRHLADDMTWKVTPTSGSSGSSGSTPASVPVIARATTDGTHNGTIASAATERVRFDTVVFDSDSAITTGASWVFTAPVTGYYRVEATVLIQTEAAIGDQFILRLVRNGTDYSTLHFVGALNTDTDAILATTMHGSDLVQLDENDTIYIEFENQGNFDVEFSSTALDNHVSIFKVN